MRSVPEIDTGGARGYPMLYNSAALIERVLCMAGLSHPARRGLDGVAAEAVKT